MRPIVRLAVVEDQTFTRQTTVEIIRAHFGPPSEVVGLATVEELMRGGADGFDLVVLDLQLRGGGLEGTAAVEAVARHTNVLVFSGLASGEALQRAQAAGAHGYVGKDTAEVECLIEAIEAVLAGSDFVDPGLLSRIGASARKQLSPRQQEVLRLEALGCKVPQIAIAIDPPLTSAGVRRHIERIVEIHPDCAKQADRVRLAINLGLVTPWELSRRHANPTS